MKYVLGFDIGGTKSAVLLARPGEEQVEFLERKAIPTCGAWREMLDCLAEMGKHFWKNTGYPGRNAAPAFPAEDRWTVKRALSCRLLTCQGGTRCRRRLIWSSVWAWMSGLGMTQMPVRWLNGGWGGKGLYAHGIPYLWNWPGAGLILSCKAIRRQPAAWHGKTAHVRLAEEGPVGYGKAGSFEGFCSGGGIARLARSMAEEALKAGTNTKNTN